MYFSGNDKREQMFKLLVMKTRELGRQVTFAEAEGDDRLPKANDYAYYYGEYAKAAEEALRYVKYHKEDENSDNNEQSPKGVVILSKKTFKPLDEGRKKAVMDELVEMFIKNGCKMPTSRMIKKNRYIKDEEVDALRRSGDFTEHKLRKLADERLTPEPAEELKVAEEPEIAPNEEQETDVSEVEVAESTPEVVEATELEEEPVEVPATPVEVSEALDESEPESTEVSESESSEKLEADEVSEEEPVLEDEPEVVALPVEEPETKEEVSEMVDEKKTAIRYTSEECINMLREACLQAGHVLTQYEVKQLSSVGKLPVWATLQRQVGPWYTWDELFSVPFASENAERIAQERKKQAEEPLIEEPVKEECQYETPIAPEEAFEPEDDSEETEETEGTEDTEEEYSDEEYYEESEEVEMIEVPIKVILPKVKGIKGTVNITIEF